MVHLIDKDALVVEIERRISLFKDAEHVSAHTCGYLDANETLLSFINSLKVTEVDLEKEISEYFAEHPDEFFSDKYKLIAKHFYELGFKAQKGE